VVVVSSESSLHAAATSAKASSSAIKALRFRNMGFSSSLAREGMGDDVSSRVGSRSILGTGWAKLHRAELLNVADG